MEYLSNRGILVAPDAVDIIAKKNREEIDALISYLPKTHCILTRRDIERFSDRLDEKDKREYRKVTDRSKSVQKSEDYDTYMNITWSLSYSDCILPNTKGFHSYFQDRFDKLRNMLKKRYEMNGVVDTSAVQRDETGEQKIIGIIKDTNTTKKGHRIIELEDKTGTITCFIPSNSSLVSEHILNDEVLGVVGRYSSNTGLFIVNSIVRPDIPLKRKKQIRDIPAPVEVIFTSDIHVGSMKFMEHVWYKFVRWLKTEDAQYVKYIVITGDLVDGVGVYPNQDKELVISDIFKQYEKLSSLLTDIPEHIRIILLPGNHDAVELSEPQYPLPHDIQHFFNGNIVFVSNPSYISINGVTILAYHGKCIDDFVVNIHDITYNTPLKAMKEMLTRRHLAPIYGGRTPIAPFKKDYLVITDVPDIFVTGHVHATAVDWYKDILLINASCWQEQTSYQKSQGFVPDPAKIISVNLQTLQPKIISFT